MAYLGGHKPSPPIVWLWCKMQYERHPNIEKAFQAICHHCNQLVLGGVEADFTVLYHAKVFATLKM